MAELIRLGVPVVLGLVVNVPVILLLGEVDPVKEGVIEGVFDGVPDPVFEGPTDIVLLLEAVMDLVPVRVGDPVFDGVPVIVTDDVTVFDAVVVLDPVLDEEVLPEAVPEGVMVIVTVGVCDKYAHTRFVVTVQATVSDWPTRQVVHAVQDAAFIVVL